MPIRFPNRMWVLIAALLLLSSLVAAGVGLAQEPYLACTASKETGTIKLLAVRYGTRHQYPWGPLWRRIWNVASRDDIDVWSFNFPAPQLGCLVRSYGTGSGLLSVRVDDEHGCRFDDLCREFAGAPIDPGLSVYYTANFPRRSRSVKVVVHKLEPPGSLSRAPQARPLDDDQYTLQEREPAALCCTLENPALATYPEWRPEPLPVTRRVEGTTFTLSRFERSTRPDAPPNERAARFRINGVGRGSNGWFPFRGTIRDATGNKTSALPLDDGTRGDTYPVGGLCVRERAWQLKVNFQRTLRTSVPPDWLWTVRGDRVPVHGDEHLREAEFRRKDIRLTCGGIVRNTKMGREPAPGPDYKIWITAEKPGADGLRISLVRVRDNLGRDLTMPLMETRPAAPSDPYVTSRVTLWAGPMPLPIRALPGFRTLDLTFAIYRGRTAEFLVKP